MRYRIVTARVEGMTAGETFQGKPAAAPRSMLVQRLERVV
jgi:hypothetical protein